MSIEQTNRIVDDNNRQLAETVKLYEVQLQNVWNSIPTDRTFITPDKQSLKVLTPGTWNFEAGPDFKNAKIKIDDEILTGPVEIHTRTSDWYAHGHHHDPAYQQVILHVTAINDLPPEKLSALPPLFVINPTDTDVANVEVEKLRPGKCAAFFSGLETAQVAAILKAAGIERFKQKSNAIMRRMIADGAESTCLRMIFEAVGYKNNRQSFTELFQRFGEYDTDLRQKFTAAILWGESGLLPETTTGDFTQEMSSFIEQRWKEWWQIRISARPGIDWKRTGRPVNSPERRIAAIVAFLQQYGENPLAKFATELNHDSIKIEHLLKTITFHDQLWDNYSCFTGKRSKPAAVLGRSSALELLVNVLLPAIDAVGKIDKKPTDTALNVWCTLPSTQHNRITRDAAARWFPQHRNAGKIMNGTAARQGIIHLSREFCEKCCGACDACLLYNST
jgi:Protein of unknown function (DUF2851)